MGTRKERFIELHGEEAWKEKVKRENERDLASKRRYKERNRLKIQEASKQYYAEHKEHYAELQRKYIKTKSGRAKVLLANYKRVDKEYGFGECTLTQSWILNNILSSNCIYCGDSDWRVLGCDRIDNTKGHTPDNVVCACLNCNAQRQDRMSVEEFIEYKKTEGRP